ncbi:hypothetical protein BGZ94_000940, partial [Podila epigama]
MKFAKYLQEEAVPEWRKAYINYKQGKKLLNAIESALDDLEATEALALERIGLDCHLPYDEPIVATENTRSIAHTNSINTSSNNNNILPHQADDSTPSTPILSRPRGSNRNNYSSIVISTPTQPLKSQSIATTTPHSPAASSGGVRDRPLTTTLTEIIAEEESPLGENSAIPQSASLPRQTASVSSTGEEGYEPHLLATLSDNPSQEQRRLHRLRAGSAVLSQFGHSAMSQSSQILKNLSRRFTIIYPYDTPTARVRSIQ